MSKAAYNSCQTEAKIPTAAGMHKKLTCTTNRTTNLKEVTEYHMSVYLLSYAYSYQPFYFARYEQKAFFTSFYNFIRKRFFKRVDLVLMSLIICLCKVCIVLKTLKQEGLLDQCCLHFFLNGLLNFLRFDAKSIQRVI